MDVKEFAAKLNGRVYGSEITPDEEAEAKQLGFLVVFGYSDDSAELRGSIHEEVDVYDSTEFMVTANRLIQDWDDFLDSDPTKDEFEQYFKDEAKPIITIVAKWGGEGEPCWCMDVAEADRGRVEFAPFAIDEDGEPYCRGIVVDMNGLAVAEATP